MARPLGRAQGQLLPKPAELPGPLTLCGVPWAWRGCLKGQECMCVRALPCLSVVACKCVLRQSVSVLVGESRCVSM